MLCTRSLTKSSAAPITSPTALATALTPLLTQSPNENCGCGGAATGHIRGLTAHDRRRHAIRLALERVAGVAAAFTLDAWRTLLLHHVRHLVRHAGRGRWHVRAAPRKTCGPNAKARAPHAIHEQPQPGRPGAHGPARDRRPRPLFQGPTHGGRQRRAAIGREDRHGPVRRTDRRAALQRRSRTSGAPAAARSLALAAQAAAKPGGRAGRRLQRIARAAGRRGHALARSGRARAAATSRPACGTRARSRLRDERTSRGESDSRPRAATRAAPTLRICPPVSAQRCTAACRHRPSTSWPAAGAAARSPSARPHPAARSR